MADPTRWLIAGPTGSGKSTLAIELAARTGGEIVNADSMQVYRDLRVLTARPAAAEEARARHHLFGVADAAEAWSAGRWLREATPIVAQAEAQGAVPIVVGGTGLYLRALTGGLAEIPAVPVEVRAAAAAMLEALGEAAFRARLAGVDAASAARIAPGDRQRLTRAWEVFAATERSLSDWRAAGVAPPTAGGWRRLVIEPPRVALYASLERRLDAMIDAGALEEVARLLARTLDPALPAMKALGVAPFAAHLRGALSLDEARALTLRDTRRYARRQLTWLRHQAPDWPRAASSLDALRLIGA